MRKKTEAKNNLKPLIEFLKFVDESSDEEFAEGLEDWIEIDSFVRMMALDKLLQNNDSFIGMGSNYYLFWSEDKEIFTMLSWDQNLALAGMNHGGGDPRAGQVLPEDMKSFPEDFAARRQQLVDDFRPPEDFPFAEGDAGSDGGGKRHSENVLYDRFFENEAFVAMYNEAYAELEEVIFENGLGLKTLESLAEPFIEYNEKQKLIDAEEYESALNGLKEFFLSHDVLKS